MVGARHNGFTPAAGIVKVRPVRPAAGPRPAGKHAMTTAPTLIFDLDGTLIDTAADLVATLNVVLAADGLKPITLEQGRVMVGLGARKLIERGLDANGVAPDEAALDRMVEAYLAHYREHIADSSVPFPGVTDALDRFATAGWKLGICTNKPEALSRLLLGKLALADRFGAICGADTFARRKPHPEHLLGTIAMIGGDPAHAIMVGDSITDIDAARNAAVPVVAVDFGYSIEPIATLGADRVISHFDALDEAIAELRRAGALA